MLKFCRFLLLSLVFFIASAQAQVEEMKLSSDKTKLIYTGFDDYPPFGSIDEKTKAFVSVFDGFLKAYKDRYGYETFYDFTKEYGERIRQVRRGDIDVIFGIYHDTEGYEGLDYIYPSIVSNPITVIMLPSRINEVKSLDDLKKLKGARLSKEKLSDYILNEVKKFNVVEVDNSYDLFGKLFKGEVDYILTSHYFGLIEAIKLGLRDKIAFAKNPLWEMPLFIGVSKIARQRGFLHGSLEKLSSDPEAANKVKKHFDEIIKAYEEQYQGVVPPDYSVY